MRRNPLVWALSALVLVVLGAGGGYLIAGALDDDGPTTPVEAAAPTTSEPHSNTIPATAPLVVSRYGVVAWWQDGKWLQPADGEPPVRAGETYRFVGLDGDHGTATGSALGTTCEISEVPSVDLDPAFDLGDAPAQLAVSGVAEPLPRPVEPLDGSSATYKAAARDALAGVGIHDGNPKISQLLRVDLEGDGSDEVLVTVGFAGKDVIKAKKGDYSAVIVRRVVDGQVRADVLVHSQVASQSASEDELAFLDAYRIVSVADLNGDGDLEIGIDHRYYEGVGVDIYDRSGDGFAAVAGVGCGA